MWFRPDAAWAGIQLIGKWGESTNQGIQAEHHHRRHPDRPARPERPGPAPTPPSSLVNFSSLVGARHPLAVTYDGRGNATAADGLTLYTR
ncbi:MAG: hypothetical protein R2708_12355 [Vicinamibacterales bacterium]